jgi:S-adenosylmethionine hydrolase
MPPIITLTTDYGLKDSYVAGLKGAILTLCPAACLVDVTHLVPPQNIRWGAFVLATVFQDFPAGTVHLAVVDPEVGTNRRGLAVTSQRYRFVGPDNGIFSLVLQAESSWEARSLENPEYWGSVVSTTFHGRDVFAPVAAHVALGVPFQMLGPPCIPVAPTWGSVHRGTQGLAGEVLGADHFGNIITNLDRGSVEALGATLWLSVLIGGTSIDGLHDTYGAVPVGSLVALIGSHGYLEVAVNQGNAAEALAVAAGACVRVRRRQTMGEGSLLA